jgi:uncharacterized protein YcfJ
MKIVIPLLALGTALASGTASATEYGRVLSSTPLTTQVSVPRQDCADQQAYVQPPTSGGGAVVGGVLGGLAGNAIGAGGGRALATAAGAVAGALVGNNVEAVNTAPVPVTTTNCTYSRSVRTRVTGYDVVYEYNGQQHRTRLARDPGDRIALDLTPSGALPEGPPNNVASLDAPYPAYPAYPPAYPAYPAAYPYDPYPYAPYPYGAYGYAGGPYGYVGVPIFFGAHFGGGGGWHGGRRGR